MLVCQVVAGACASGAHGGKRRAHDFICPPSVSVLAMGPTWRGVRGQRSAPLRRVPFDQASVRAEEQLYAVAGTSRKQGARAAPGVPNSVSQGAAAAAGFPPASALSAFDLGSDCRPGEESARLASFRGRVRLRPDRKPWRPAGAVVLQGWSLMSQGDVLLSQR